MTKRKPQLGKIANLEMGTLALLAILVLAAGLRFYHSDDKAPGIDEQFQQDITEKEWGEVFRVYTEQESNPPLQTVLGKIFYDAGGSYYFVRVLSVLAALGAIIFTFLFARDSFGEKTALLAAFLLALNPLHVFFSQHTRSYSFLAFTFSILLYIFFRFLKNPNRKNSILLALSNALVFYTHYAGLIVLLCEIAYFTILWYRKEFKCKTLLPPVIISILLILPWSLALFTHLGIQSSGEGYSHSAASLAYPIYKMAAGADISFLLDTAPMLFYAVLISLGLFLLGLWKLRSSKDFIPLSILFFLPFPLIAIASLPVPALLWPRNFSFLLPLFAVIQAIGLRSIKDKRIRAALLVLLGLGFLAIIFFYYSAVTMPGWNTHFGL